MVIYNVLNCFFDRIGIRGSGAPKKLNSDIGILVINKKSNNNIKNFIY